VEAALVGAGYRVMVLNPLQTRRYGDVVRRKAKTDDIDAHVVAGLLHAGATQFRIVCAISRKLWSPRIPVPHVFGGPAFRHETLIRGVFF